MDDTPRKVDTPEMFSQIAHRYDLLNHLLSLNIDRHWRRKLVRSAGLTGRARVLDACTGTGDVAIGFARALPEGAVVGVDRSEGMLAVGREKIKRLNLDGHVSLEAGDVLDMPYGEGEFDAVTIAFGLRNLPDYAKGVAEMVRVLKPGGRLLVLEFSPPASGLALKGYNFYLQRVVPAVGGLISGSWRAYRYLASSIGDFLPRDDIIELLQQSDLVNIRVEKMAWGITHIFRGERAGAEEERRHS